MQKIVYNSLVKNWQRHTLGFWRVTLVRYSAHVLGLTLVRYSAHVLGSKF